MLEFANPALVAPDGCIVGVIEEGTTRLCMDGRRRIGPDDPLPSAAGNYILEYPLSKCDAVARARSVSTLLALRRAGATFVMVTHDEPLLEACADEIWWLRDERLIARGDPAEVLERYRRHVAAALRALGTNETAPLAPMLRNGDGRASLEAIELLAESGVPSSVWRSGERVAIRVTVRYAAAVSHPVIGILIRTRIGLNVYGTNTELERIHFGPVAAGDTIHVTCRFECALCPGDYTITAASHDPDGTWHDWQEDAVAFAVTDARFTAGVANLRAVVTVEHHAEHQRHSANT